MNPALKFKQRMLAQAETKKPTPTEKAAPVTEESLKVKQSLANDLTTLKALTGDEERLPHKAELIEKYREYVTGLMQSHANWARLEIVFWWLMWRYDVEGFEAVQEDMLAGIEHGLTTPTSFNRDWQTIYLDQVNEYTSTALQKEVEFNDKLITQAVSLLSAGEVATNIPLKAKLWANHGKTAMLFKDYETAAKSFTTALKLDDKVGVKKLLAEAEKGINDAK